MAEQLAVGFPISGVFARARNQALVFDALTVVFVMLVFVLIHDLCLVVDDELRLIVKG